MQEDNRFVNASLDYNFGALIDLRCVQPSLHKCTMFGVVGCGFF